MKYLALLLALVSVAVAEPQKLKIKLNFPTVTLTWGAGELMHSMDGGKTWEPSLQSSPYDHTITPQATLFKLVAELPHPPPVEPIPDEEDNEGLP